MGPVVEPASEAFDRYWNSDWTVPIEDVVTPVPTPAEAKQQQEHLDAFAADTSHYPPGFYDDPKQIDSELIKLGEALLWGTARLLVDAVPEKGGKPQTRAELDKTGVTLARIAKESSDEILIQSAYLVLLDGGFEAFSAMTSRGVTLKLATNSMASNNHLTAFVGYAKQRRRLLETGAELYEMRPDAKSERALFTAAQLEAHETLFGLHAKTSVFDRKITFVGSFNVDPRSVNLNTEMGTTGRERNPGQRGCRQHRKRHRRGQQLAGRFEGRWKIRMDHGGKRCHHRRNGRRAHDLGRAASRSKGTSNRARRRPALNVGTLLNS